MSAVSFKGEYWKNMTDSVQLGERKATSESHPYHTQTRGRENRAGGEVFSLDYYNRDQDISECLKRQAGSLKFPSFPIYGWGHCKLKLQPGSDMPKVTLLAFIFEPRLADFELILTPLTGALLRSRKAFSLSITGFPIYATTLSESWPTHIGLLGGIIMKTAQLL